MCVRVCFFYDVGTLTLGFKGLISHLILPVRTIVLLLLREVRGVYCHNLRTSAWSVVLF
jgi:hypothetical protein